MELEEYVYFYLDCFRIGFYGFFYMLMCSNFLREVYSV